MTTRMLRRAAFVSTGACIAIMLSCASSAPRSEAVFDLPGMDVNLVARRLNEYLYGEHGPQRFTIESRPEREQIVVNGAAPEQVREIERLVDSMRRPPGDPLMDCVALHHGDAQETADRLRQRLANIPGYGQITVTCDARMNQVVVVGADDEHMAVIRGIIAEFDLPDR